VDGNVDPQERTALVSLATQTKGEDQLRGLFRVAMALPAYQLN